MRFAVYTCDGLIIVEAADVGNSARTIALYEDFVKYGRDDNRIKHEDERMDAVASRQRLLEEQFSSVNMGGDKFPDRKTRHGVISCHRGDLLFDFSMDCNAYCGTVDEWHRRRR